jgi:hypothetical protein
MNPGWISCFLSSLKDNISASLQRDGHLLYLSLCTDISREHLGEANLCVTGRSWLMEEEPICNFECFLSRNVTAAVGKH